MKGLLLGVRRLPRLRLNSSTVLLERREDRASDEEEQDQQHHGRREKVQAEYQPQVVIHGAQRTGVAA